MSVHPAIRAALNGNEPTEQQRAAIEHPLGPLAIIAGAGSGKTAVMAARIAHMVVDRHASPAGILGLTFTNKAADELRTRITNALEHVDSTPGEEVSVFTYHGFADRLLRDYGPKIGVEPETALLTEAQAYMLVGLVLEDISFEHLRVTWVPSLVGKVRGLADALANHLLDPHEVTRADGDLIRMYGEAGKNMQSNVRKLIQERPDYCKAVAAYLERKARLGRIDYGDQIALAFKIVNQRPEVAAALRDRWPTVLLDEYQDTNVAQRRMMETIYLPGSSITVVGDPDQAIYAWRGATLYNIVTFAEHFTQRDGSDAPVKPLEVSFRSGDRILQAAEAIISEIPTDVRGVDKKLRHHPPTGEGEVTADLVASEAEESALIAAEINRIAGPEVPTSNGNKVPYSNIAILCRARRLFTRLEQRLREENIPVEVVGLGGLLATPEVVDLLAYLKVIAAPGDNISFARVAMGPRWRVHYRDLAALARWAATNTGQLQQQLEERDRIGEVDPGEERFSLLEAAARIDEIDDISGEARDRLRALHSEIERMRGRLRGVTLAEAIEQVLSSSGIEDELLVAGTPVAEAARANLSSFLDRASAFSPLEGEASLTAFLNWVDAAREAEDLEIAQPQQENSVKLMTVHQAKGLEFDVVFVPGMTDKSFPDTRVTDNPLKSVSEIPYWIREDRKYLPRIDFVKARFEEALKVRAMQEERRLAYVAFTRAKKALHISAAYWYGERATPGAPGLFFTELAGAPATEEREARPAHEAVTVGRRDEAPETNPMRDEWERRAEQWPPQDESVRDALFELGGRRVLEQALADPSVVDTLVAETEVDLTAYEKVRSEIAGQLELLPAPAAPPAADERLRSLSVSSIVQLARCPKQFYWTVVRPLPRRPSAAARLGHDIHRWIEIRSIGQGRLDDPEDLPDLTPEELEGDGGTGAPPASWATELKRSFEHSRFAAVMPRFTEQPFTLALPGGLLVRGRIDAVYVHDYATWELVDYKTGREPDADDEVARLQLSIYALAARRIWGVRPEQLTATYFYLKTGRAEPISGTDLITQESDLVEVFKRIEAGRFDPQPGRICNSCDFLRFCGAGRAYMAAQGAP